MGIDDYKKAIKNDKHLVEVLQSFSLQMQKTAFTYNSDPSFIDDVISQTVLIVYKKRKSVRKPEYFKTWVIRILINECKKEIQKQNKYVELIGDVPVTNDNPQSFDYIHYYLEKLSDYDQELIRLKVFSELTFKEISTELNISESTVKSQYYKILDTLKWEMEDVYE